jgi:hypothetical protein
MAYAENTEIAAEKSVAEIIGLIKKGGAERIGQIEEPAGFAIQFFLNDRMLRFRIRWPTIADVPQRTGNGQWRDDRKRAAIAEQRKKQRARALLLVIKAKLESVESGVETFEEAFLANVVMPDGKTVGELTLPAIATSYRDGKQPPLLLASY